MSGPIDAIVHLPLAPWWKRLVAILLDSFVAVFAAFVVAAVIGAALDRGSNTGGSANSTGGAGVVLAGLVFLYVLAALPLGLYYGFTNGSRRGQTIGKMALGIAVRDSRTGGPVGFWRAFGRYWITVLFGLLIYVPYLIDSLSPLWDSRRQSWHDRVAHTVVVEVRP